MHRKRVPIALGTTYVVPPKPADPFSASPNAQSNARYVSAVVSRSMAHDARKGAALAARRTYESSLLERLRAEAFALKPTTTEPAAATWEPPAVGDRGAQEVVHWVACLAKQLSAADACAPAAPAGATAAEVAAVLGAPLQRKRLEFSTDSPDERARRLAKLLGALLDHHSNLCRRADDILNGVPPLLRELAPRRPRSSSAPPRCCRSRSPSSPSLKWYPPWRRILACERTAQQLLLSALREWGHDGLGALRHHPPWLRPGEMAALPAQQRRPPRGGGSGRRIVPSRALGRAPAGRAVAPADRRRQADGRRRRRGGGGGRGYPLRGGGGGVRGRGRGGGGRRRAAGLTVAAVAAAVTAVARDVASRARGDDAARSLCAAQLSHSAAARGAARARAPRLGGRHIALARALATEGGGRRRLVAGTSRSRRPSDTQRWRVAARWACAALPAAAATAGDAALRAGAAARAA